jgi:hypothetical protein
MTKRKEGQTTDSFSLSADLLAKADRRAKEKEMSRSGFYRYCLAKELGYSPEAALALAEHRAVVNLREAASYGSAPAGCVIMNDGPASSGLDEAKTKEPK